jgi:hypothetical protein
MPTWPSSLPDAPLQQGYQEQVPNTLVRTEMDKGPAKVRRRSTAGTRAFTVNLLLTEAQVVTLDSFIDQDLDGGALRFDWTHPRTGAAVQFRLVPIGNDGLVSYQAVTGNRYRVQMRLEILP